MSSHVELKLVVTENIYLTIITEICVYSIPINRGKKNLDTGGNGKENTFDILVL